MVKGPAPDVGACEIPSGRIELQKDVNKISINTKNVFDMNTYSKQNENQSNFYM